MDGRQCEVGLSMLRPFQAADLPEIEQGALDGYKFTRSLNTNPELRAESLMRRRLMGSSHIIIGSHRYWLICQDCRNVASEVLRRTGGLTDECLTLPDLKQLVDGAGPNANHEIDFEQATLLATSNKSLLMAIEEYRDHQSRSFQALSYVKQIMKGMGWPWIKARDAISHEYAELLDLDFDESGAFADWLLDEAKRFDEMAS